MGIALILLLIGFSLFMTSPKPAQPTFLSVLLNLLNFGIWGLFFFYLFKALFFGR